MILAWFLEVIVIKHALIVSLAMVALVSCGGGGSGSSAAPDNPAPNPPVTSTGDADSGSRFFNASQSPGNQFSCANCHAIEEDAQGLSTLDGLHRPAHPLFNVLNRSSWYNSNAATVFDAVNICLEDWMGATPLSQASSAWLDLEAFFTAQSSNAAVTNVMATPIEPLTDFSQGDISQGQATFNQTCATCHGENAQGGLGLAAALDEKRLSATQVAEKVRTTGNSAHRVFANLAGGNMPLWTQQRLSDVDLGNIAVFVDSIANGKNNGNSPTCSGTDNPLVGKQATLITRAHQVSGTARVINNCTIEVSNFVYDGQGPAVKFYLGMGGDYSNDDNAIGDNLLTAYNNDTLTITFTDPTMLDNIDGISVWCYEFNVSFGDGLFE